MPLSREELTQEFVEILNRRLSDDFILDSNDISINSSFDSSLVVYWARKPTWLKRYRFRQIVRQTRNNLKDKYKHLSDQDFTHFKLKSI